MEQKYLHVSLTTSSVFWAFKCFMTLTILYYLLSWILIPALVTDTGKDLSVHSINEVLRIPERFSPDLVVMNSTPLKVIIYSFLIVFWTKFESKDILYNLLTYSTLKYKLPTVTAGYVENWTIQLYIAKPGMASLFRSTHISTHLPHLSMHAQSHMWAHKDIPIF